MAEKPAGAAGRGGADASWLLVTGSILSSADEAALSGNPQWESSRFGELERFILNFLVGGTSAGESVRLKLQTPLFVADALLEAAAQQLEEDLAAAEQAGSPSPPSRLRGCSTACRL